LPRARTEFKAGLRASRPLLIAVAWHFRATFVTIISGPVEWHAFDRPF
jgi:hypothetical protein